MQTHTHTVVDALPDRFPWSKDIVVRQSERLTLSRRERERNAHSPRKCLALISLETSRFVAHRLSDDRVLKISSLVSS